MVVYFMNCLDIIVLLLMGLYWPLLFLQRPAVKATVQQQRKMREEQRTTGINQTPKAAASQGVWYMDTMQVSDTEMILFKNIQDTWKYMYLFEGRSAIFKTFPIFQVCAEFCCH